MHHLDTKALAYEPNFVAQSRFQPRQLHLASLALAITGLVLIGSAHLIVTHAVALLQPFDVEGTISKPDLLLRPVYTLSLLLIAVGVLNSAMLFGGKTLAARAVEDAPSRLNIAVSVIFVVVMVSLYAYATTDAVFFANYFFEDKPIENLTPVLYLVSFVFYSAAFFRYASNAERLLPVAGVILFCALVALFLGLEEISYGQRIFGWHTPPALAANVQHESNLHNLLSYQYLDLAEWCALVGVFLALCGITFLKNAWPHRWLGFAPRESLLPLAAALAILSSHGAPQEVFENSTALFALLYSVQLMRQTSSRIISDAQHSPLDWVPEDEFLGMPEVHKPTKAYFTDKELSDAQEPAGAWSQRRRFISSRTC